MARIWGLAALVAGIWLLSVYGVSRPDALGLDASPAVFSAARADQVLGRVLGAEQPHPVGSVEAQAVRGRILKELAALGVAAHPQTEMSCVSEARWHQVDCASVTNIVADVLPGEGKAVLLMAHSDSVAAGPGAGDDGSGVAILLETIRALKASGEDEGRPVTALFSDGEEPGLLGASAYVRQSKDAIAAAVNSDVRGDSGVSMLFQTSPGDAGLVNLYARNVRHYATSSVSGEIYKYMPNDTDLTPVLQAGLPGMNFAFIGDVAAYHTPLDRRANLDPRSIQQQGDSILAMARALRQAPDAQLKSGGLVYLDVLGLWLPRLPLDWALPLSVLAFVLIALAGFVTRRGRREMSRPVLAGLMPPLLLAGALGLGFVLHGLAAWISGHDDPSFATPVWLRLSLGLGVWAMALATARLSGAVACWLWLSGLAIVCAIWMPGAAPYFLFPSLVAAPLMLATARGGRGVGVFLAALPALVIWVGFSATGEALDGLVLHELFTLSLAMGLVAVLPLLRRARSGLGISCAVSLVAALVLAVVAGLQPAYTAAQPQRLNLRYVERNGKAWWVADGVRHLPDGLRGAAHFSDQVERQPAFGYVAPAGAARFPAPGIEVSRQGGDVTLALDAPGDSVTLSLPREAQLRSLTIAGIEAPAEGAVDTIICATPDCGTAQITLHLGTTAPFQLRLRAMHRGLPPSATTLLQARPPEDVPSQTGDTTVLTRDIAVPPG